MYDSRLAGEKKRRNAEKKGLCPQCGFRKLLKHGKQCRRCTLYRRAWTRKNSFRKTEISRHFARRLRVKVLHRLGGRCASKNCRYLNADGTFGCADLRVLHIDHKKGNGNADRKRLWSQQIFKKVLRYPRSFQLLCPTCNWIKRMNEKEYFACRVDPITEETYKINPGVKNETSISKNKKVDSI